MEVIRAGVLGFCMGVRRAFDLAASEAQRVRSFGGRVYTLGPLIHNPRVLADLENLGVEIAPQTNWHNCSEYPKDSSFIIRAHGISRREEEGLRSRGYNIVDATCPKVKASQLKAEALVSDGYRLFLAGEAEHAEIAGIIGYAGAGFCEVVENAEKAQAAAAKLFETEKNTKTALIGQTTISEEEYSAIGTTIRKYFPSLEIIGTICAATRDRQQALRELLNKTDAIVIAGGKESANTRRLLSIAQSSGKPAFLAENAAGLPAFLKTCKTIGLCAGASTPDSVIEEIERELAGSESA